jgi:hypothetical protein
MLNLSCSILIKWFRFNWMHAVRGADCTQSRSLNLVSWIRRFVILTRGRMKMHKAVDVELIRNICMSFFGNNLIACLYLHCHVLNAPWTNSSKCSFCPIAQGHCDFVVFSNLHLIGRESHYIVKELQESKTVLHVILTLILGMLVLVGEYWFWS